MCAYAHPLPQLRELSFCKLAKLMPRECCLRRVAKKEVHHIVPANMREASSQALRLEIQQKDVRLRYHFASCGILFNIL